MTEEWRQLSDSDVVADYDRMKPTSNAAERVAPVTLLRFSPAYGGIGLAPAEFIRRFLIHVLPKGLHRIRHYGQFANGSRVANLARARELLGVQALVPAAPETTATPQVEQPPELSCVLPRPCPCCGGRMIIIVVFARGCTPKHRPSPKPPLIRIGTS